MKLKYKKVSQKEYQEFLYTYPNKLEVDVTHICDPPMEMHSDLLEGKVWPESIVAKRKLNKRYRPEDGVDEYWILDFSEKEFEIRKTAVEIAEKCRIGSSMITTANKIIPILEKLLRNC